MESSALWTKQCRAVTTYAADPNFAKKHVPWIEYGNTESLFSKISGLAQFVKSVTCMNDNERVLIRSSIRKPNHHQHHEDPKRLIQPRLRCSSNPRLRFSCENRAADRASS